MPCLASCSRVAAVRNGRHHRRAWESIISFIHTSSPPKAQSHMKHRPSRGSSNMPSRTRLVKDLKPRSPRTPFWEKPHGKLEVAPRVRVSRSSPAPESFSKRYVPSSDASTKRIQEWEESASYRRSTLGDAALRSRSTTRSFPSPSLKLSEQTTPSHTPSHKISIRSPVFSVPEQSNRKPKFTNPLGSEFDISAKLENASQLPQSFAVPPLMEGLLTSIKDVLGPDARPTPIQSLSLKHLFRSPRQHFGASADTGPWHQFLLASETGSGKSIAYLLPMLQSLKQSELQNPSENPKLELDSPRRAINPRGLVLAPTHELSRQLAGFAKALLHNIKLRVLCTSRENMPSRSRTTGTASKMAVKYGEGGDGMLEGRTSTKQKPVDLLVGTPMKVLEMARGRGWNWEERENAMNAEDTWDLDENGKKVARVKRKFTAGEPDMGLEGIEWVVVDEADVLFDPDFQESTRMLLADIAAARGYPVPFEAANTTLTPDNSKTTPPHLSPLASPLAYPFNLLLTTATIPSALASYLDTYHPSMTRLASPHLHHLPRTLQTEYAHWTGGNRNADVERRIRRVWAEDAVKSGRSLSKVLIFCNRSTKVEELGQYLESKGIANVALTSSSDTRKRGSNHHLDGFLRTSSKPRSSMVATPNSTKSSSASGKGEPHVMITTSLLSRGLDFSPSIQHVFIMDEPRNMIDFLHRAGRSGRAGQRGKVVVFGKMHGRGSLAAKEVRKKVGALAA